MADARFVVEAEGRFAVIGEMTFATANGLLASSDDMFSPAAEEVVVDLGKVTRVDSAGLALLIEWLREARCCGKAIHYRAVPAQLVALARVSDLDGVLPFSDS